MLKKKAIFYYGSASNDLGRIKMKSLKWLIGSTMLGATLIFGFGNMLAFADGKYSESEEHEERNEGGSKIGSTKTNALYKEECGACHMAYPAGLLPKKSWNKIMANLENHFDENAEVDTETGNSIKGYLAQYALGSKNSRKTKKMLRNFPKNKVPLRITELPYFIRKHDEIPSRMVKNNPKVGSFSQCQACHGGAESGDFNEHQVKIPGYGRWED